MIMKTKLDPKRELLLKAIVNEYIQSATPVASLSIGGHGGVEASSATIRNWMSELEHLGFLKQPHPSAGRIPTDKAYRHYVNLLMETENLSPRDRRKITKELDARFREVEDLLHQAAEIVSEVGGCTALALQPASKDAVLKKLEMVRVSEERILLVLLTESGFVFNRVVEIEASGDRLDTLSRMLNQKLSGVSLSQIGPHLLEGMADEMMAGLLSHVLDLIARTVADENKNKVLVEGTHLLLEQPEFQDLSKFKSAVEVLNKEDKVSRLLGRVGAHPSLHVYIGDENPLKDFSDFSVIAAPYGTGEIGFGTLAIVGPTRMDYSRLIPLVEYTSAVLSRALAHLLF